MILRSMKYLIILKILSCVIVKSIKEQYNKLVTWYLLMNLLIRIPWSTGSILSRSPFSNIPVILVMQMTSNMNNFTNRYSVLPIWNIWRNVTVSRKTNRINRWVSFRVGSINSIKWMSNLVTTVVVAISITANVIVRKIISEYYLFFIVMWMGPNWIVKHLKVVKIIRGRVWVLQVWMLFIMSRCRNRVVVRK